VIFTPVATPPPDFESLRVKGLNIALPGPQDTIDPDFAGIRSSLAAFGIGYIGWSSNSFYNNMLPAERATFGQQAYNGQKPTFFTNNVMQVTFDLSRYGIPDGQIVIGGVYNFDTWAPAGPNALSLATLSYYQTFLNKRVELKVGYLANALEFGDPFWPVIWRPASSDRAQRFRSKRASTLLPGQLRRSTSSSMVRTGSTTNSAFSARAARMVPPSRRSTTRPV
jgi:hypothetical protein